MNYIITGIHTEGTTDNRFLTPVIERTLTQIALECPAQSEIIVQFITVNYTGASFIDKVKAVTEEALKYGCNFLCIHADADNENSKKIYEYKINPAIKSLQDTYKEKMPYIIPLIPVQEMEAWMLADKELLKDEIGTTKSDTELYLPKSPEQIAKPKERIEEAIHIATRDLPKKRQKLNIADLYLPIGQSVSLTKLAQLSSYLDFQENIRKAFKEANFLH